MICNLALTVAEEYQDEKENLVLFVTKPVATTTKKPVTTTTATTTKRPTTTTTTTTGIFTHEYNIDSKNVICFFCV